MRRIKFIVALGAVMAAMLALSAGTAMADEWNDWNDHSWNDCDWNTCDDGGFDEVIWVDEGTAAFDQLCSPGLPEGIWIPGCVFSDPIEEDHFFDVPIFVVDDIDFDEDCDCDDHHFRDDDWRFHDDDWRFRDER
jgi:hypothetical protein